MDEVIIAQLLMCIVKAMANANKIGGKGVVNEQWPFMDCQRILAMEKVSINLKEWNVKRGNGILKMLKKGLGNTIAGGMGIAQNKHKSMG